MPKMRWTLWMEEYWMAGNCEFRWHDMVVQHPLDTEVEEATIGAEGKKIGHYFYYKLNVLKSML